MLQTFEASLEPNGGLRFLDAAAPIRGKSCRVLVTFLPTSDLNLALNSNATSMPDGDWKAYVGVFKHSPRFAGDPLALQQQLRGEWN